MKCTKLGRGAYPIQTHVFVSFFSCLLQIHYLRHSTMSFHVILNTAKFEVAERTEMGPEVKDKILWQLL